MARVLLVEDDDQVHRLLCDEIRRAGHDADCVRTKAEAEAVIRAKSHDLLVSDVKLPDGSGHDLAALAAGHGIKPLLITGHPDEATVLRASGVLHMLKPFTLADFTDTISQCLGP